MQLNISIKSLLQHLALFVAILYAPSYFPIPFIVIALIYFYKRNRNVEVLIVGIYAIACKTEIVYFAYILTLVCLYFTDKRPFILSNTQKKIKKRIGFFFIYLVIIYLFQLLDSDNGSMLSLPFYALTFLSSFILLFVVWRMNFDKEDIQRFCNILLLIAICQFIIALFLQAVPIGINAILERPMIGDMVKGTTINTRGITSILIVSILVFVFSYKKNTSKNKKMIILLSFLFVGLSVLNDSKMSVYALVLSLCIFFVLTILKKQSTASRFLLITISLLTLIFMGGFLNNKLKSIQDSYYDYIWGNYNAKVVYYEKSLSFSTRPFYQYILGTGGGTNGSRAANALASNSLAKSQSSVTLPGFIPPHSNAFTKKFIAPLYTEEDVETTGSRSAVLGNPFNSFCAMYVELGVVGFLILFSLFLFVIRFALKQNSVESKVVIILILFVFISALLFPAMENASYLFPLYIYMGFMFNNLSVLAKSSNEL